MGIKVKERWRDDRALRDTCPDNPRLWEAVTEQGLGHAYVEVVCQPSD